MFYMYFFHNLFLSHFTFFSPLLDSFPDILISYISQFLQQVMKNAQDLMQSSCRHKRRYIAVVSSMKGLMS